MTCGRHIEEIASWRDLSVEQKELALGRAEARMAAAGKILKVL